MRDQTVIRMQQGNAKRSALLLAQFEFLKTRQEAFERVAAASTVLQRLAWALWPAEFIAAADRVQLKLLQESRRKMAEAAQEAAKPKIITAPAGLAAAVKA